MCQYENQEQTFYRQIGPIYYNDKDFIIVARTDARATEGLDKAIERGLYYKKIGADVIFVEAPKSIKEMELSLIILLIIKKF